MIGHILLHYEVVEKIGQGGMGEVYRAQDVKLGRSVALKLLSPDLAANRQRLARFRREAKTLAALDHPNIVHIYSVESEGDLHFLTMQLVAGRRLADELSERGWPLDRFFDVALQLTDGLRAAHERGVTHRDLKPTNVMIDDEGRVRILDFGLAKLLEDDREGETHTSTDALTREGLVVGTVPYMSPEQVRGEAVDQRTDVFSIGVLLYQMATGRHPFEGASAAGIAASILRDEPPSVTAVRKELPNQLARIVGRCLAKEPRERYQTVLDVYNDLRNLRQEVSGVTLHGVSSGSADDVVRSRAPVGKAALAVAALAIAAIVYLGYALREPTEPAAAASSRSVIAIAPFAVRGSPAYGYLSDGLVDLLSTKLDGAGELRAVDPHAVLGYASERIEGPPTLAQARSLGEHFGAGLFVVGEIVEAGGRLYVSASLYRVDSASPTSNANVEGSADELFALIDRLAAELVTEQVSGPGAQLTRLAAVTTESLPALKLYLQGESELRTGQFNAALDTFERTVEIDPEFALAWYRLSVAAEWAVRRDQAEAAARRAVSLSERLSTHHRDLLEARVVSREGRPQEAERLYRTILGSHPEDVEAWTQLAEVLSHYTYVTGRSAVESREAWERVLELEPDSALAMWHLVRVEALEGRVEALRDLVQRLLALAPEAERAQELRAIRAFVAGSEEEQHDLLAGLDGVSDSVVALIGWNLALVTDDHEGVAAVAHELTDPGRSPAARAVGHSILAFQAGGRGDWLGAQVQLDQTEKQVEHYGIEHRAYIASWDHVPVSPEQLVEIRDHLERWTPAHVPPSSLRSVFFAATDGLHSEIRLLLLGLIQARLGDASALDYADQLEAASSGHERPEAVRNLASAVRSAWYRRQGDARRSLEALQSLDRRTMSYQDAFASPFHSLPYERFQRGVLAAELGEIEAARRWLSTLSELSFYDDALVGLARARLDDLEEAESSD